jgi:methylmalonyl-CoA mutase
MNANHPPAFTAASKEAWKLLVAQELKAIKLDQLPWEIAQDVFLNHYYTTEEVNPNTLHHIHASQRQSANWLRAVHIKYETAEQLSDFIEANSRYRDTSFWIHIPALALLNTTLHFIWKDANQKDISIYFIVEQYMDDSLPSVSANLPNKGGIVFDPLTNWMRKNSPFPFEDEIYDRSILTVTPLKIFQTLCMDGDFYHNKGADPAQELGFILSNLVHTLDRLTDLGVSPREAFLQIFFSVSVGTKYLTEIAKLRALRFLIHQVADTYGVLRTEYKPFIHVNTSAFYHTSTAPHLNLIRSTSEAMSAVIGGCDSLWVQPYEAQNSFAERMGNNISYLLSHEAHFNTVADQSRGSYLIENATQMLIEAGWAKFLTIQKMGGVVETWQNGYIKKELDQSFAKKIRDLDQGSILMGVNQYQEKPFHLDTITCTDPNLEMAYMTRPTKVEP